MLTDYSCETPVTSQARPVRARTRSVPKGDHSPSGDHSDKPIQNLPQVWLLVSLTVLVFYSVEGQKN